MEFEDKIILHGFREENVGGRLVRWEGGKCEGIMRWQGGKGRENGDMGRWEFPGFIQGWGTQGESKILSFCF